MHDQRIRILAALAFAVAGGAGAAASGQEEAAPAAEERVWSGYLFKDRDGAVRVGWGVVAMGVMAQPAHRIEGELGKKLEPLAAGTKSDWWFWNYELEKAAPGDLPEGCPRHLVKVRGRVVPDRAWAEGHGFGAGSEGGRMTEGRLLEVEPLDRDWLLAWSVMFRDRRSPFRVAERKDPDTDAQREFAQEALAALRKMRAVGGPGAETAKLVRDIDPDARLVDRHRRRTEAEIQRWLVGERGKLGLEGLDDLGPLPPSSTEIQGLFLGAGSKAEFLARLGEAWKGPVESLDLVHYVSRGNSTSWHTSPLTEVRDAWTEADFQARQATTRGILGK